MRSCVTCSAYFVPADEHQHRCGAPACRKAARTLHNYAREQRRKAARELARVSAQEVRS